MKHVVLLCPQESPDPGAPVTVISERPDEALYDLLVENTRHQRDLWIYLTDRPLTDVPDPAGLFRAGMVNVIGVREPAAPVIVPRYVPADLVILPWESQRFVDLAALDRTHEEPLLGRLSTHLDRLGFSTFAAPCASPNPAYENLAALNLTVQQPVVDLFPGQDVPRIQPAAGTPRRDLSLLVDLSHFRRGYNGTMEYGRELVKAMIRHLPESRFGSLMIMGQRDAIKFHGIPLDYHMLEEPTKPFDVCFRPYQVEEMYDLVRLLPKARTMVMTQLDVIGNRCQYINAPQRRTLQGRALLAVDGILYISGYGGRDVESFYGLESVDLCTKVTHLGAPALPVRGLPSSGKQPSFLVIGNSKYDHKFLRPTLNAVRVFLKDSPQAARFIFLSDLSGEGELPPGIVYFHNDVPQHQLEKMFAEVDGFIYPSVYEGFGLPLLHAIRYGKRVLMAGYDLNRELAESFGSTNFHMFESVAELPAAIAQFVAAPTVPRPAEHIRTWDDVAVETLDFLYHVSTNKPLTERKRRVVDSLLGSEVKGKSQRPVLSSLAEEPLVTVILTSYNYEYFVATAIRSVFKQTYKNIELIIVDDGSPDHSQDVIAQTIPEAPPHMTVKTIFKANGGQSSAVNVAYEQSSGEIICFIDSDDVWYEDKVEKMVNYVRMCPDGGVYQHQLHTRLGPKQSTMISHDVFARWKALGPKLNVAFFQGAISPFVATSGLVFRRAVLDKIMPLPPELITCPDGYLTRTAAVYGPLYSFPGTLGEWRDHDENAGKSEEYSYLKFWVPVLMESVNRYYREHDVPLQLVYKPTLRSRFMRYAAHHTPYGLRKGLRRIQGSLKQGRKNIRYAIIRWRERIYRNTLIASSALLRVLLPGRFYTFVRNSFRRVARTGR